MSKQAISLARKARKAAPEDHYAFARAFEKAIEELANEIEALRGEPARKRP